TQGAAQSSSSGAGVGAPVFYNALFDVPNPYGVLCIGMSAQVSIVQGVIKNALAIPASALREQGPDGRFLVRVVGVKGGEPEERRIRIGVNNHNFAQVIDGLKEGDEVILGDLPGANGPGS